MEQFTATPIQESIERLVTDGREYTKPISNGNRETITYKQLTWYLLSMELARPSEVFRYTKNGLFTKFVDRRSESLEY